MTRRGSCARPADIHAAPPATAVMKSRRLIANHLVGSRGPATDRSRMLSFLTLGGACETSQNEGARHSLLWRTIAFIHWMW